MREEKGSITIEASVSLVLFTFVMVTLLTFINVGRTQAIIQNALNKSAAEISQYTYLYYLSGLYEFDQEVQATLSDPAAGAEDKLNGMLDSVDGTVSGVEQLFASISKTKSDAETLNIEEMKADYDAALTHAGTAKEKFDALMGQVGDIADNPLSFVKGLAAMGLSCGINWAKAFIIGSVLSKSICTKYLGAYIDSSNVSQYSEEYADQLLKDRGIEEGLDGLNFAYSSIFYKDTPTDINIVVVYDVKVLPLLGDWTVTFAQSASCCAWLGGDETSNIIGK